MNEMDSAVNFNAVCLRWGKGQIVAIDALEEVLMVSYFLYLFDLAFECTCDAVEMSFKLACLGLDLFGFHPGSAGFILGRPQAARRKVCSGVAYVCGSRYGSFIRFF